MTLVPNAHRLLIEGSIDFLLDFGKFCDEEEEIDDTSKPCYPQIHPLKVVESVRVAGFEEGATSNDGAED